jgi:polyhydroxybutyrate depolymerase
VGRRLLLAVALAACGSSAGDDGPAADAASADATSGTDAAGDPTGACGDDGAPTGADELTVTVAGAERVYLRVVPADYDPDRRYPVVFAWHGRTSNGAQLRSYAGLESEAGGGAIFIYPDGLGIGGNPSDTGWDLSASSPDLELFDVILAALKASHCIDADRVFSTGHSFGGYMSNHLACSRGGQVRAIAPVAGGGPTPALCDGVATDALIIHGSMDEVVPVEQGEGSRDYWLGVNGCSATSAPVSPAPCQAYDGCGDHPVVWCQHDDATFSGHGWPAFAAGAIWGFFTGS